MSDIKKNVFECLLEVQKTAHAPREINGKFGKGRSAEQILEAYKPICNEVGLYLSTSDAITNIGSRNYITSTATVVLVSDPTQTYSATASAWEGNIPLSNSGSEILDTSQVSGKTSSYAKKYALQNLFAIDDTKDADQDGDEVVYNSTPKKPVDDAETLARAKVVINDVMKTLGITDKTAKVEEVLSKKTIDNLDEANKVMDELEKTNG